jgi:4-amino-4-deoxy-L-arabinose transferase
MALWLMAISIKLFGVSIWAVRLPSILLSSTAVLLTYQISKSLFDKKVAFFAAFLHAIHGLSIELAGGRVATDHIDSAFAFFIELGILWSLRIAKNPNSLWASLVGVSTGLAVLTKWLPGLIVLPIGFLLCLQHKIPFVKIVLWGMFIMLVSVAVFLPWQLYIMDAFPQEAQHEYFYNNIHLTEGVEGHAHPFYYHFDKMRMIYGELIYLPMLWLSWQLAKQVKPLNFKFLVLIVWIFIPYFFFSFAATKMQAYTLFTAPAIFMVTALFYYYLQAGKVQFKYPWLATLIGILLWVLPVRYGIERVKPFAKANEEKKVLVKAIQSLDVDDLDKKKTVVFNAPYPIQMMFFTGLSAYSYLPKKEKIDRLKQDGIKILVWDKGKVIFLSE